jgi:hypothetical protein
LIANLVETLEILHFARRLAFLNEFLDFGGNVGMSKPRTLSRRFHAANNLPFSTSAPCRVRAPQPDTVFQPQLSPRPRGEGGLSDLLSANSLFPCIISAHTC